MTKQKTIYSQQKAFFATASIVFGLIFSYLLFFGMTIFHTLERQRAESEITKLKVEVSELEFSFLALKASINLQMARELGFVDAPLAIVAKEKKIDVVSFR